MMTGEDIDALFARTLQGDADDEGAWAAIRTLFRIGAREVFDKAAGWLQSPSPLLRARGANVLSQLGVGGIGQKHSFPDECFAVVAAMLRIEKDSFPQEQAINALGHIGNPAAAPLVAAFAAHENTEVRFAVAVALGCFPNEPVSIDCLLVLMRDDDEDVREWATFGLGRQGDADSDDIRAALMVRLDDPFVNVRLEAIASLGKRRERRILSVLLTALEKPEIPMAIVEACWLMLGLENDREDWTAADYAKALRERWEPVLAPYGNGKCL